MKKVFIMTIALLVSAPACFRKKKAHVEEDTIIYVNETTSSARVSGPIQPNIAWTDTDLK